MKCLTCGGGGELPDYSVRGVPAMSGVLVVKGLV